MKVEIKNNYHLELLKELKKYASKGTKYQQKRDKNYAGTTKLSYGLKTSDRKQIVKAWIKNHPHLTFDKYVKLLNSLYSGNSHDEISLAGKLLKLLPKFRRQLDPHLLKKWLEEVEGWAEVDSICQSKFSAAEILNEWNNWSHLLKGLSVNDNVHKKRACLVLLTRPVRESTDSRLAQLAFENIENLKQEKDILITKAVSWLLREMIKNYRDDVEKYLRGNKNSLPAIAVRETTNKLKTGKK